MLTRGPVPRRGTSLPLGHNLFTMIAEFRLVEIQRRSALRARYKEIHPEEPREALPIGRIIDIVSSRLNASAPFREVRIRWTHSLWINIFLDFQGITMYQRKTIFLREYLTDICHPVNISAYPLPSVHRKKISLIRKQCCYNIIFIQIIIIKN